MYLTKDTDGVYLWEHKPIQNRQGNWGSMHDDSPHLLLPNILIENSNVVRSMKMGNIRKVTGFEFEVVFLP